MAQSYRDGHMEWLSEVRQIYNLQLLSAGSIDGCCLKHWQQVHALSTVYDWLIDPQKEKLVA